jgi:biopolymer transport protein ExbD
MSEAQEAIPEGINDLPDPDSFARPAGEEPRKRKKKNVVDDNGGPNINSLMDIMTILLVFLLKSYSADPVQLKAAPDLKPPFSTAQIKPDQSATVTITLNNLMVDDSPVLKIEQGKVDEAHRSGGGFMIDPLFEALQSAVENQKQIASFNSAAEFSGIITIISDRNVPFSLLSQVMYTAGQAEFNKFKFLVVKGSG